MTQYKQNLLQRENKLVSITEAAKLNRVTRQAIYVAIKLNKLKAKKDAARWEIHLDDLADYKKQKYSRAKSQYNGELVFNPEIGQYSIHQVAKLFNVPLQKIYYATRSGKLKAHRKGAAWVIHIEDANAYREMFLNKKRSRRKAI